MKEFFVTVVIGVVALLILAATGPGGCAGCWKTMKEVPPPPPRPACKDELHSLGSWGDPSYTSCDDERQVAEPAQSGLFCRCKK